MTMAADDSIMPLAIRVIKESGRLELDWADGQRTGVTHSALRKHCRCGECVARRRVHGDISVVAEIRVVDVTPFGANAVRLTFSDGHGRGIYPFAWLQYLSTQP